jgi:hypothetical protein
MSIAQPGKALSVLDLKSLTCLLSVWQRRTRSWFTKFFAVDRVFEDPDVMSQVSSVSTDHVAAGGR